MTRTFRRTFDGTQNGSVASPSAIQGPDVFTAEAWFKTSATSGGKIIGFGAAQTGNSGSYDRHVYMDKNGRIVFGVYPGSVRTVTSSKAYNDGQWHQVVASLGPNGMNLYVDALRVGTRTIRPSVKPISGTGVSVATTWADGRTVQRAATLRG